MSFAERIKYLRERKCLTQQDMASILGISKSTYVKYERGEREPKFEALFELSKVFDVSTDYLLGMSDEENRYIYSARKAVDLMTSKSFLETLGKHENAVTKMVGDYTSFLFDLEFDLVDLFYMTLNINQLMEDVYAKGILIFSYQPSDFVAPPDEKSYADLNKAIRELRKRFDDYLYLLQSPHFYNLDTTAESYYFSDKILAYKHVDKVVNINSKTTNNIH